VGAEMNGGALLIIGMFVSFCLAFPTDRLGVEKLVG
jgi:hypothetical protein